MKEKAFVLNEAGAIVSRTGASVAPAHRLNNHLLDILNGRYNSGEWRAVRRVITLLKRRGWVLAGVWDGETMERPKTTLEALAIIFNLDEISLRFRRADYDPKKYREHGVLIILGNDPDGSEVVSDWNYSDGDPDGFDKDMEAITGVGAE